MRPWTKRRRTRRSAPTWPANWRPSATVEAAGKVREALAADCDRAREEKAQVESDLGPCEDDLNRLKIEEEGLRVKAENLSQRAKEELEIDLAQVTTETPVEDIPDPDALAREVDDLRSKLSGFGAVNVVALEQLNELEEREKYMLTQTEDLTRSKSGLEELIRELNKESKELFEKTFELVKEQFGTIFRKLFGGGQADIVLETGRTCWRAASRSRPARREGAAALSLLSGGEQTLTAIALLLAIFRNKPQPVLPAGRGGRGPGRGEHAAARRRAAGVPGPQPVHRHHAQEADDGGGADAAAA